MLLTCPRCATIFWMDANLIPTGGKTVRCAICNHIWTVEPANDLLLLQNRRKALWKHILWVVFAASLVSSLIIIRTPLTAYAPFLINGFNFVGLIIRPALSDLQLVELSASYVGDTLRLSGELRNVGMWPSHASDLRVTVRGADGTVVNETVIRPDHDIINAKSASGFFVQLVLDAETELYVTVTPLANRIYR